MRVACCVACMCWADHVCMVWRRLSCKPFSIIHGTHRILLVLCKACQAGTAKFKQGVGKHSKEATVGVNVCGLQLLWMQCAHCSWMLCCAVVTGATGVESVGFGSNGSNKCPIGCIIVAP